MPPAAISRSSTYFPKICGNIAPLYLSLSLVCACGVEPPLEKKLPIRVFALPNCPLPADAQDREIELHALGDFGSTNQTGGRVTLGERKVNLPFPEQTQALELRFDDGERTWIGYSERRGDDGIDVLFWPERKSCALLRADRVSAYPGTSGGQAIGHAPSFGLLLVAGGEEEVDGMSNDSIVGAATFDSDTGTPIDVDAGAQKVLHEPRAFATVTELGSKLLVAGGENPLEPAGVREPRRTAEIYDPEARGFEPAPIELLEARTHHASLALPDGRALLIGGRNESGASNVLEAVSPETGFSSIAGLARMQVRRIEPKAIRLSDGRILIGGGYDGDERAAALIEWFEPDASQHSTTQLKTAIPARFDRAFVAMPGGGFLAVGGCEDRVVDDGICGGRCTRGCQPRDGYDAFWVTRDGEVTPIALPMNAIVAHPILMASSDGAPWLFADESADPEDPSLAPEPAVYRFNPMLGSFREAAADLTLDALPSQVLPEPTAVGLDTVAWLTVISGRTELIGMRLSNRSRFAEDQALVAVSDPFDLMRPLHLSPDRFPGSAVRYQTANPNPVDGDCAQWQSGRCPALLTLIGADASVTVMVTDTDYLDFTLKIDLDSGPPPLVILGDYVFGDEHCPWVRGDGPEQTQPAAVRRGANVDLSFAGGRTVCPGPEGRVTIGLLASPSETTQIRRLDVLRGAD